MASYSMQHRRSVTTTTIPQPPTMTSMRNHSGAPRRGSEQQQKDFHAANQQSWRHRRANSHVETHTSMASTTMLRTTRANTLPALPVECLQAADAAANMATKSAPHHASKDAKPVVRKGTASRADQVDNWRVKSASRLGVPKGCPCSQTSQATLSSTSMPAQRSTGKMEMKETDSGTAVLPQVLPPIRVSMEPAPVEVLPPLRFSMDPAMNGRSAWRFVLPETESKPAAMPSKDVSTEELIDDLPSWFTGKESDIIVRMGNSVDRPLSPSACSSSSAASSSSCSSYDGERQDAPPLDYYGDEDDVSSTASSQTASPVLGGMRQLRLFSGAGVDEEEDTSDVKTPMAAMQYFAVPSLSAAAPLPSLLPMPSFLARTAAK